MKRSELLFIGALVLFVVACMALGWELGQTYGLRN